MNKLILTILLNEETGEEFMTTFHNYYELHKETFSPHIHVLYITDFKIKGNSYKEKKVFLQEIAKAYSNSGTEGMFWSELVEVQNMFYKLGKRYGLLREFRENCIC